MFGKATYRPCYVIICPTSRTQDSDPAVRECSIEIAYLGMLQRCCSTQYRSDRERYCGHLTVWRKECVASVMLPASLYCTNQRVTTCVRMRIASRG